LRHCEERSDEAIHERRTQPGLLRFARNDSATRMSFISRSGIDQTYTALINGLGQSFRFRGVGHKPGKILAIFTVCSHIVGTRSFAMATDTTVRARIDERVKKEAARVLEDMGLSVSDAIRMLLMRVVAEKALPFEVKVPNAVTARTLRKAGRGEDLVRSKDAPDLFRKLGI
jgi:DNA-damage-inducible protein J